MAVYKDLADKEEDERIRQIGEAAMSGKSVAFITDDDPDKAERYILKLLSRFPRLYVVERLSGPVKGTVSVKVKRRADQN